MNIERAAISARPDDIATKLRFAPAWVRAASAKAHGLAMAAAAKPSTEPVAASGAHYGEAKASPSRRFCGWLSGCVAPSVAVPCFNHVDKLRVREQFTPACWEMVLDQARRCKHPISLRYGHEGDIVASTTDISLTFDIDRLCGLLFDARLRDDRLSRSIVEAASGRGLAVSIAYKRSKGWTVEREGGTVRVIDECIVDHVAVLPEPQGPAYRGARCYGEITSSLGSPLELRKRATLYAWQELKREAGVKR
jgi:hypothetical protein